MKEKNGAFVFCFRKKRYICSKILHNLTLSVECCKLYDDINMKMTDSNDYIGWVNQRAMRGKNFFTKEDFLTAFSHTSEKSLAVALSRLVEGRWIMSPWQNFYVVVPIQYKLKGMVPPAYYIDELMKFLGRRYYVSLLSAAALHGASHQVPMSFFVTADGDPLRNAVKSGTKLLLFQRKDIDVRFVREVRTETGYMMISSPLMTALDLVQNERKVGGLGRVAEVLLELMEVVDLTDDQVELMKGYSVPTLQRLGHLLGLLEMKDKEEQWLELCRKIGVKFAYVALKASVEKHDGDERDELWKVIVNYEFDIDEI